MSFSILTKNLKERDGVWFSPLSSNISYPASGNADCFNLEEKSFWFSHRNKCIQSLIKEFLPKGILLDVGGGNGFVAASILKSKVCEVALLEPGLEGILNAKSRGVNNLICSTLEGANIEDGSLSSIGLFDVLEHVKDDVNLLKQIYNLLQPGGYLYITVPAHSLLWSTDDEMAGHYRRYSIGDLRKMLKNNGFDVRASTYIFAFLVFPMFLLRTIPTFFKKNQSVSSSIIRAEDHSPTSGRFIIDIILKIELFFFQRKIPLPFGGSCICVAQKPGL